MNSMIIIRTFTGGTSGRSPSVKTRGILPLIESDSYEIYGTLQMTLKMAIFGQVKARPQNFRK